MRIQRFPIDGEEPPRLELRWDGGNAHVYLDATHRATLSGISGLKQGWTEKLTDGRTVEIRSIYRVGLPELSVLIDGNHLATSPSHPARVLKSSSNILLILSAFLIYSGITGSFGRNWLSLVVGAFYLVGALFIRKKLAVGVFFLCLPVVISVVELIVRLFTVGLTARWFTDLTLDLLFITFIVRSLAAIRDARELEAGRGRLSNST